MRTWTHRSPAGRQPAEPAGEGDHGHLLQKCSSATRESELFELTRDTDAAVAYGTCWPTLGLEDRGESRAAPDRRAFESGIRRAERGPTTRCSGGGGSAPLWGWCSFPAVGSWSIAFPLSLEENVLGVDVTFLLALVPLIASAGSAGQRLRRSRQPGRGLALLGSLAVVVPAATVATVSARHYDASMASASCRSSHADPSSVPDAPTPRVAQQPAIRLSRQAITVLMATGTVKTTLLRRAGRPCRPSVRQPINPAPPCRFRQDVHPVRSQREARPPSRAPRRARTRAALSPSSRRYTAWWGLGESLSIELLETALLANIETATVISCAGVAGAAGASRDWIIGAALKQRLALGVNRPLTLSETGPLSPAVPRLRERAAVHAEAVTLIHGTGGIPLTVTAPTTR